MGLLLLVVAIPFDGALTTWGRGLRDEVRAHSDAGGYAVEQATQSFGRVEGTVAVALLLMLLAWGTGRSGPRVATLVLAVVLAGAASAVVKVGVGRMRPGPVKRDVGVYETRIAGPVRGFEGSSYRSFPSGHTTQAAANATVMAFYHPLLLPAAIGLTVLVGAERVYTAKHFPSDVVAGAMLGTGVALVVVRRRERGGWRLPWEARGGAGSERDAD